MSNAEKLFRDFHGRNARDNEIVTVKQTTPEETLEVGQLYGIMYKVQGTKEPYLHKFGPGSKAKLLVSADGKQIYIIGGSYKFTDRGFIG